ncbi:SDR family oxidoreductase [Salininema proteolyticum]|uniref:SDR family oxidoreductase n=1 Tax=Salininema proteolyticum TaxID=1607685 RepID=A0ABV8U2L6_9ACTN
MDLGLEGKTAIVTGASRGIGLATVKELKKEGVRVVGASRTIPAELEEAAEATVSADLSTPEGAAAVVEAAEKLGGVDLLVNNVGGGDAADLELGGILDTDDGQWKKMLDLNLYSAVWTTKAALPSLLERRGAIVTVSTINSRVPAGSPVGYGESKAALSAFTKRLSEEFGPKGVRVNTVSPGVTLTSLWQGEDSFGAKVAEGNGATLDQLLEALPEQFGISTGRLAEPEDMAATIAFLLSERAVGIHGTDVVADGGTLKHW